MLADGKVSVPEAEQLLQAVASSPAGDEPRKTEPKYFRILVNKRAADGKRAENVNIKVPMTIIRGGLRLGALLPGVINKKITLDNGAVIDLSKITYTDLEAMIKDIGELTVDVDGEAQVRIRCE
jgi:hypothetical protein